MAKLTYDTVTESNSAEAIRILAEAFHDDPVMNWACNYPPSLEPFFEITLPPFLTQGLTYIDTDGRGVACWQGPNQHLRWPYTLSSVHRVLRIGGLKGVYRMIISGKATEKYHPKTPHYYLFAIGVLPQFKGQGLGTGLLSQTLRTCDEEGVPAYLENSKEENLDFYEGHGFKIMREVVISSSAPPIWLMWREPRTGDQV